MKDSNLHITVGDAVSKDTLTQFFAFILNSERFKDALSIKVQLSPMYSKKNEDSNDGHVIIIHDDTMHEDDELGDVFHIPDNWVYPSTE
jgi:hypothetical protein